MTTAVIGGGASGYAAAIAAARAGGAVTVFERAHKPLRKLCASGNGRGNLLNRGAPRYYGDADIVDTVFSRVPARAVEGFWRSVNVPLAQEGDARVYPVSRLAQVACDALLAEADSLGIVLRLDSDVIDIIPQKGGGFDIVSRETLRREATGKQGAKGKTEAIGTRERRDSFARVILCAGGSAAPQLGTDGSAYALLEKLGHGIIPPRPALCPLVTACPPPRALRGLRLPADIRLTADGSPVSPVFSGELLIAEDGISGIAAMQLARFLPREASCAAEIDLRRFAGFEDMSEGEIASELARLQEARGANGLFTGRLPKEAARALISRCGADANALARGLTRLSVPLSGSRGFGAAQVTAGGLPSTELKKGTLESRRVSNLFIAGEALNVDGDCGGFNLMFAVASGMLAGGGAQV